MGQDKSLGAFRMLFPSATNFSISCFVEPPPQDSFLEFSVSDGAAYTLVLLLKTSHPCDFYYAHSWTPSNLTQLEERPSEGTFFVFFFFTEISKTLLGFMDHA